MATQVQSKGLADPLPRLKLMRAHWRNADILCDGCPVFGVWFDSLLCVSAKSAC